MKLKAVIDELKDVYQELTGFAHGCAPDSLGFDPRPMSDSRLVARTAIRLHLLLRELESEAAIRSLSE